MTSQRIRQAVEAEIETYEGSKLHALVSSHGEYVIKFVQSRWASHYRRPRKLKISETPALTWGTATYVTPLAFPLSSALYGRIGLVTSFSPQGWRVFDATRPSSQVAYVAWARSQPSYSELLFTVHSTHANHLLRNRFRESFRIDCVLFHPDQEAEIHTDSSNHIWMAVTDWNAGPRIKTTMSDRLSQARFTVLLDEDFDLEDGGLPIQVASRKIERATTAFPMKTCTEVGSARRDPQLPQTIARHYNADGYLHVFIDP